MFFCLSQLLHFILLALFLGNWKVLKSWTQVIWYGATLAKTLVVISAVPKAGWRFWSSSLS